MHGSSAARHTMMARGPQNRVEVGWSGFEVRQYRSLEGATFWRGLRRADHSEQLHRRASKRRLATGPAGPRAGELDKDKLHEAMAHPLELGEKLERNPAA